MPQGKEFIVDNGILVDYRGSDKKVTVPDGIKKIGNYVFSLYEDGNRTVSSYKLRKLKKISEVYVPGSVESIEDNAFRESNITKVVLSEGLIKIGDHAFETCNSLEKIVLPSTLKIIGKSAFSGVQEKTEWKLPDGLLEIGDNAFEYDSIEKIYIPNSVKKIGKNAFTGVVLVWDEDGFVVDEDDTIFTIYGQKGSVAEDYAKDNKFKFVDSDHCPF